MTKYIALPATFAERAKKSTDLNVLSAKFYGGKASDPHTGMDLGAPPETLQVLYNPGPCV